MSEVLPALYTIIADPFYVKLFLIYTVGLSGCGFDACDLQPFNKVFTPFCIFVVVDDLLTHVWTSSLCPQWLVVRWGLWASEEVPVAAAPCHSELWIVLWLGNVLQLCCCSTWTNRRRAASASIPRIKTSWCVCMSHAITFDISRL